VPEATPVTTPDADPTIAIDALLLAHIPPPVELLNVVVLAILTVVVPEIAPGAAFTVTIAVTVQPELTV